MIAEQQALLAARAAYRAAAARKEAARIAAPRTHHYWRITDFGRDQVAQGALRAARAEVQVASAALRAAEQAFVAAGGVL